MKRVWIALLVLGLMAVGVTAAGAVTGKDKANAARECRALKKAMGTDNFRDAFGTNKNKHNAFGKCEKRHEKEQKEAANATGKQKRSANKECKAHEYDPHFTSTHEGKS